MRGKKKKYKRRKILPDSKYNNILVARFINKVLRQGKKDIACSIVYGAFDIVSEKTQKRALDVFQQAVENTSPKVEVISRRIGGATYQIPIEVKRDRQSTLALRWIVESAKAKSGKSMTKRLASEILDAYNNTGGAVKKKEDTHRMAEANKAFAHLARF
jgi:small subunit ribosomal protein S7